MAVGTAPGQVENSRWCRHPVLRRIKQRDENPSRTSLRSYSLSKRSPIKVTQSPKTERFFGGIDLVQKRHVFVELPEHLLKEYWDTLKKSMGKIAGSKSSKHAKISCAEWLQVTDLRRVIRTARQCDPLLAHISISC